MSAPKKKGKHETIKPGKSKKEELSDKDLDKAVGAGWIENKF